MLFRSTSCSGNSQDCIEYDSDISSNNSIFFYSDSDEFIDNRFLRINHTPFMKLLKENKEEINNLLLKEDSTKNIDNVCNMSRVLKLYDNKLFDKIDELNDQIEIIHNKIYENIKKK